MEETDSSRRQALLDSVEEAPDYRLHDDDEQVVPNFADATGDGRLVLNIDAKIADVLARLVEFSDENAEDELPPQYFKPIDWNIRMNIVMHVVGSRGDVQPFIALGNELQKHGHRVRLATHNVFKSFVTASGLEFFPIGGDPTELMAYMVKNPGLLPSMKSLQENEIGKKRKMIAEMLVGCWRSCIEADPETGVPFVANAIIANPPSFAHIHCAQALFVPLHIVFTMPWSPTRAFPHPLANIKSTNTEPKLANYLSYSLMSVLTWQGLGDIINHWRKSLGLEAVPLTEAPFIAESLKIPHTYCWSTSLIARPRDWPSHIAVSGFIFRPAQSYTPHTELEAFLQAGPPPVYIGFGSIVVDDPKALLATVLEAVHLAGVRAVISKGWSNLSDLSTSSQVLFIEDCPHEWLFQHVSAVVHHGGAGTTAIGLLCARPTVIVPFFGDQQFWGDMVASIGAGPSPIPYRQLTATKLASAIQVCLSPEINETAKKIALRIRLEDGVKSTVDSIHRQLQPEVVCCDLVPTMPAVYKYSHKRHKLNLSGYAAETLAKHSYIRRSHLKLLKAHPIIIENRRWDPLTSSAAVAMSMSYDVIRGTNDIWYAPHKLRKKQQLEEMISPANVNSTEDTVERSTRSSKTMSSVSTGAKLVGASAMAIPKMSGNVFKGLAVDTPLALAEGLRATPRLYGEEVKDHEHIDGVLSGMKVAGMDMVTQFGLGLCDLAIQPYKGARKEGALGFAKGVGKGTLGTFSKMSAGVVGLIAYPAQGIYKSLHTATHSDTESQILSARRVHDIHLSRTGTDGIDEAAVIKAFISAKRA